MAIFTILILTVVDDVDMNSNYHSHTVIFTNMPVICTEEKTESSLNGAREKGYCTKDETRFSCRPSQNSTINGSRTST